MDKTSKFSERTLLLDPFTSFAEVNRFLQDPELDRNMKAPGEGQVFCVALAEDRDRSKGSKKPGRDSNTPGPPRLVVKQSRCDSKDDVPAGESASLTAILCRFAHSKKAMQTFNTADPNNSSIEYMRGRVFAAHKADRAYSPLTNMYAKQWDKFRREIAHDMQVRVTHKAKRLDPDDLATRSNIILHMLSRLPEGFERQTDITYVTLILQDAVDSLTARAKQAIAAPAAVPTLPLVIPADWQSKLGQNKPIAKRWFALALNRVITHFAGGTWKYESKRDAKPGVKGEYVIKKTYDDDALDHDLTILARFAGQENVEREGVSTFKPRRYVVSSSSSRDDDSPAASYRGRARGRPSLSPRIARAPAPNPTARTGSMVVLSPRGNGSASKPAGASERISGVRRRSRSPSPSSSPSSSHSHSPSRSPSRTDLKSSSSGSK